MTMQGDAPEGQPGEGVDSLSDLGGLMERPEELEEGEEAPEESEEETEESEREDDEEEQESDDEPAEPVKHKRTIKHDGKEIELELTDDELDARLQQSFDYTQKTMAVAEDRKAVKAERDEVSQVRTQVEQERDETARRLQAYTQYIEAQVGQPPDPAMLDYDTAGYLRQKEQHDARKGQLQQAYAALQQIQDESARQRQAEIAEKAAATEQVLRDTLPGWNDDKLNDLAKYADGLGLNPETASEAMLSPGFWQLADKAKAFDALQAQKAQLKPKKDLPRVTKPGASNPASKPATEKARRIEAFSKRPSHATLGALFGD